MKTKEINVWISNTLFKGIRSKEGLVGDWVSMIKARESAEYNCKTKLIIEIPEPEPIKMTRRELLKVLEIVRETPTDPIVLNLMRAKFPGYYNG